jgi:polysaccharide biosynthesis protein PslH
MVTARRSAEEPRRALVVWNRLPFPLDDGAKIRTYHTIRALAAAAETTVAVFHPGEDEALAQLRADLGSAVEVLTVPPPRAYTSVQLLLGLLTPRPVNVWSHRSTALRTLLSSLARQRRFEIAVVEHAVMYPYLSLFPRTTRRVVDMHNVDSVLLRRSASTLRGALRRRYALVTARKLERYERWMFADADLTWVCSEPERELVARIAPGARVAVVPNGVNGALLRSSPGVPVNPQRLMFCGLMNYHPNVDAILYFAKEILPELKRSDPGIELWVVGRSPAPEILRLASREPALHVTGRVDDVSALLATAAAVVVPLRVGGGTRLKILEALAMGKPVVTTSVGMEGLELAAGRDLVVADNAAAFADAVLRLLRDPTEASRMAERGRATVERRYLWRQIEETLRQSLGWTHAAI